MSVVVEKKGRRRKKKGEEKKNAASIAFQLVLVWGGSGLRFWT